jgi:hypothetical protein
MTAQILDQVVRRDAAEPPDPGSQLSVAEARRNEAPFVYSVTPALNSDGDEIARINRADGPGCARRRGASSALSDLPPGHPGVAAAALMREPAMQIALLRLTDRVVRGLKAANEASPASNWILPVLDELIGHDAARPSGLLPNTEALLAAIEHIVAGELLAAVANHQMGIDYINAILAGERGWL